MAKKPPLFEVTIHITEKMFMSFIDDVQWRLNDEGLPLTARKILAREGYREKLFAEFRKVVKDVLHQDTIAYELEDAQGNVAHDVAYGPLFRKDFVAMKDKEAEEAAERAAKQPVALKVKSAEARRAADILKEHGINTEYWPK